MISHDRNEPVYLISIAAGMLKVHPQTLRIYEREGLVAPRRVGNQRLYSQADIERLHMIVSLTRQMGVNRAGVDIILRMQGRMDALQREVEQMLLAMDDEVRTEFQRRIRLVLNSINEED